MLRGKYIAINDYIKEEERFLINNTNLSLTKLKIDQTTQASKRKEIIKIRAK